RSVGKKPAPSEQRDRRRSQQARNAAAELESPHVSPPRGQAVTPADDSTGVQFGRSTSAGNRSRANVRGGHLMRSERGSHRAFSSVTRFRSAGGHGRCARLLAFRGDKLCPPYEKRGNSGASPPSPPAAAAPIDQPKNQQK